MNTNGIDISIGATPLADFLDGSSGLDSGSYEQNINGDGKLSLSWRSGSGGGFTAGTEVTLVDGDLTLKYYLKDNYTPTPNGDGTYTWSPTFVSCDNMLKGVLVYLETSIYRQFGQNGTQPKLVKLYTFPYTGTAGALVESLNGCDGVDGVIDLHSDYTGIGITVSFDQDNIISAAQKIASALGTNSTIENGVVKIGYHDALAVSEYYDRFVVLGGTRNMGKYVINNDKYAAVTMRLTLDEGMYPDSVMPVNAPAAGHMTKVLIFDDIYPEMKLTITSVRARICYLYDEDGKLIYIVDENQQRIPKTYTKYYIGLGLNGQPYNFDVKTVIEGRTLGIVFHSGKLTGREFDLAYYDDYVDEYDSDEDVSQDEAHGLAGEYRICLVADGDTLLPNSTLAPAQGDEVSLTGVALDGQYEVDAKRRLLEAAEPYVSMYMSRQPTDVSLEEQEVITDFLTGQSSVELGSEQAGGTGTYVTTSVTTDILTKRQKVHLGTFEPQGKVASMANRLETASVSGSSATVGGGDDNIRHTAAMSLDQFKTLFDIYGMLGMKTVNKRVDSNNQLIEALQSAFNDIQDQSDRQFDIWFGEGAPSPLITNPTATANFPASEWLTAEEKALHVQDIYYDTQRAAGGTGGRAWRWSVVEGENGVTIYGWNNIADEDTLAALDQIADMSRDNVLTPSEKLVALREWAQVIGEYPGLVQRSSYAGISSADYCKAFYDLWLYLNDSDDDIYYDIWSAYQVLKSYGGTQAELDEAAGYLIYYTADTNINEAYNYIGQNKVAEAIASLETYFAGCFNATTMATPSLLAASGNSNISGSTYEQLWSSYRNAKTALMTSLSHKSIVELDELASDDVLTDIEKITVIREYERIKQETEELITQADEAGLDDDANSVQYLYREAFSALYAYLDNLATTYSVMSSPLTEADDPAMLYNGATTAINGSTFTQLWESYYTAVANLRTAIRSVGPKVFYTGANETPTPPYKVGDLWISTDANGNKVLKMCINSKTRGQSYEASDWAESKVYSDPRSLLAALADAVYKAANPSASGLIATVDLAPSTPTITSITGMPDVSEMLTTLKAFIGDVSFGIYYQSAGSNNSEYDLLCIPVSTSIPGSNETIVGGITIQMYNGSGWEYIQQSTSSLLNNLGTAVNAIVFGSNNAATEAAGMTVGQKFAKLFAQATVYDPQNPNADANGYVSLTQALFGLSIEKVGNNYVSTARLSADKIDFSAGTFRIGADHISFGGKTISMDANDSLTFSGGSIIFNSSTSIDLNAATINLNADKINWKKGSNDGTQGGFSGDIIPGGSGTGYDPATSSKFYVDQNGNVTMNNLTANNGHFNGELKTLNGRIVVDETEFENEGYTWYGIAGGIYNNVTYRDVLAFGLRDYGSNNLVGHLTLRGRGTYGGVFEVVTGDQNGNKSTLKMGANANHAGVEIDGAAGSLKLNNSSSTTKVSLDGNNGNGSFEGKGTFGDTVNAKAFISGLLNITSGSYNSAIADNIEKVLVSYNGDVSLTLPTPSGNEAGRTIFFQKRNSGNLTISHSTLNITADQSWGMFMLVWNGSSWQY